MKHRSLLSAVALMSLAASQLPGPVLDRPTPPKAPRRPHRQPNTQQEREIIEWNSAVDARKAEKRARKGGRP